jgi:outer membrane protein OmpA-like peptidoglycan-associated protein
MSILSINRRRVVLALAMVLAASAPMAQEAGAVVKSARIVESLSSKDVVLESANPQRTPVRPAGQRPGTGRIDLQIQFAFNSAEILLSGRAQLDELGQALANQVFTRDAFRIVGHTDRVGDEQYNLRLSLERAVAVRNYLVVAHGIAPQRLLPAGVGYSQLADPANPAAAINRRVEIARTPMPGGVNAGGGAPVPAFVGQSIVAPPQTLGGRLVPTP